MIYIISEKIIFNTQDSTLKIDDINDAVKLTLPAARLLEVMLNNPGTIIERDYLLTEVWDKYGLVGSDSNLNQYISILRKTLSMLGVDDFIQTIPKVGFKLNGDVNIKYQFPLMKSKGNSNLARVIMYAFFSLAIIIMSLSYGYYSQNKSEIHLKKVVFKDCSITYLSPHSDRDIKRLNPVIVQILKKKEIVCNSDNDVYFDSYKSYDPNKLGRIMLSICNKVGDNETTKCKTFFFNDRK